MRSTLRSRFRVSGFGFQVLGPFVASGDSGLWLGMVLVDRTARKGGRKGYPVNEIKLN